MTPIYAGNNRAFCRLDTGEYVCVDTNSLDSIDYLLGFEIEADVMPVFRRFLTPSSVILDIGANVGLYTVSCASVVGKHGRVYAFEGNPHTFQLLRRSAHANGLRQNANISLVNALVSDREGKNPLYFDPEALVGATMRDVRPMGFQWQSVDVETITIDNFLPPEINVDLAKIDVEGHEPFVLKGMERTIRRSQNLRIVMEYLDHMLDRDFGAQRLLDYIRDLGFHICKIKSGGTLDLVEPSEKLAGEHYLLLTRTPEADISRNYYSIAMNQFSIYRGKINENGDYFLDKEEIVNETGNIFYGPYIALKSGRYAFTIIGRIEGQLGLKFVDHQGRTAFKEVVLNDFDKPVVIDIPQPAEKFEIVAYQTGALTSVRISEIQVAVLPGSGCVSQKPLDSGVIMEDRSASCNLPSSIDTGSGNPRCKICEGPTVVAFSLPRSKATGHPIPDAPDDCPYFRCLDCDFLFATTHDNADHRQLYGESYWGDGSTGRLDCVAQSMRLVLLANNLIDRLPYELRVLDFGCGRGGFVDVARNDLHMQVWGTDINPPRWGKDWFLTDIEQKFDIVIALEVVEHLSQPLSTFRKVADMLGTNGVFAFQTASFDPEVCGRDWWYLGPANGHISLYSDKSLDVMFEKLGGIRRLSWNGYPGLQAWQFG